MIFKTIKRVLGGFTKNTEKKLKQKEEYWIGLLEEKKKSLKDVESSRFELQAKYNHISNTIIELEETMNRYKQIAKKTPEENKDAIESAYKMWQRAKIVHETKKNEFEVVEKALEKVILLHSIAQSEISKFELEVTKVRSKIAFSESVNSISELSNVNGVSFDTASKDVEDIDIEFEKAKLKINNIDTSDYVEPDIDADFEEFMK